jgi:hypothetical protein
MHGRGWMILAAAAFYLILALFFFHDAILTERVQICNDITMSTYPWALERPADFEPRNAALSDHCTVFYPWFHYTASKLREGKIPLWTPHVLGGAAYVGNLSTAVFYPLNLLIAAMPLETFFLVQSLIKVVAAGIFTYLFLRSLGMRYGLAFFGGTVYALCGYTILWVIAHITSVAVLMPALFWSTEIFLKKRNGLSLGFITLLLVVQFLGAQPEVSLCMVTSWLIYTFFRMRFTTGWFTKDCVIHLAYLAAAGLLSLGLVLYQLWPFLEYVFISYGLEIRKLGVETKAIYGGSDPLISMRGLTLGVLFLMALVSAGWLFRLGKKPLPALGAGLLAGAGLLVCLKTALMVGLKPHFLIQLFPDLYGNPLDGVRTTGGAAYPEFSCKYVGVLPFFLALVALFTRWRRSPVAVFGCLFLLSFGTVHGLPFIHQFVKSLPGFEFAPQGRVIAVSAFCLCVLSAFGLEFILDKLKDRERLKMGFLRFLGAVLVIGFGLWLNGWELVESRGLRFSEEKAGIAAGSPKADLATSPAVRLSKPESNQSFRADGGLVVAGRAGEGVEQLTFYLNGIGVGGLVLDQGGGGEGREFRYVMPLDRFEEGSYRLGIQVSPAPKPGEEPGVVPIHITHAKRITGKNLTVFLVSAMVLGLLFLIPNYPRVRYTLALAMVVADLSLFGVGYNTTCDPDLIFPDNEVTDYLSSREGTFRILPENVILQPSTNYMYEFQIIRGYDGLELPEYNDLLTMMKRDAWVDIHSYNSTTLDYTSPVLDLLGVRYIVSENDLSTIPGLKKVLDGPVKIFENEEALERAFVVGRWISTDRLKRLLGEDLEAALAYLKPALSVQDFDLAEVASTRQGMIRFVAEHFNFREWAIVDEEVGLEGGGTGEVRVRIMEEERILLDVDMRGEGLLIVTENHFPGWEARVDGKEARILRGDVTFKVIPLTDGRHEVELTYNPTSFYGGVKIALVAALLLLLLVFTPRLTAPLRRGGA